MLQTRNRLVRAACRSAILHVARVIRNVVRRGVLAQWVLAKRVLPKRVLAEWILPERILVWVILDVRINLVLRMRENQHIVCEQMCKP